MYRRTYWMAKAAQTAGRNTNTAEQLRELMNGVRRIRGSTLGLIGFGRVILYFFR
jgi:phosphoglycerate dehydrogenase-like enzyme